MSKGKQKLSALKSSPLFLLFVIFLFMLANEITPRTTHLPGLSVPMVYGDRYIYLIRVCVCVYIYIRIYAYTPAGGLRRSAWKLCGIPAAVVGVYVHYN